MTTGAASVDERERTLDEASSTPAPPEARPRDAPRTGPSRARLLPVAVGGIYAFLVAVLWLPFGPRNGMGYETTFVYVSETRPFFEAFIYSDPLRRFTQFFYQVGYQFSNFFGIDGSFLGNQLVYAALWWGRGFLTFLILRRLFPSVPLLAYAAGALVIVHASDHALNWVGQLNQFGFIFWMLLAVYLLVVALQQKKRLRTALFAVAAAEATYLCLWSYESALFILLLTPLLLLPLVGLSRRTASVFGVFYVFPLIFVQKNFDRYFLHDDPTYQGSLLREDVTPTSLAKDLVFNLEGSVEFWNWDDAFPPVSNPGHPILAGLIAAAAFATGALLIGLLARHREGSVSRRHLALLVGAGALLLVASFPAYIILEDARSLWRNQFLSGIGFGIAVAALLVLAASLIGDRRLRVVTIAAAGAVVAYAGGSTAYQVASFHYGYWDRHRDAIAQVLEIAPRVEHGTVIALTNVPKDADPFGHNMWFDFSIRLAYPHTAVAGVYFYRDGEPSTGKNLALRGQKWVVAPTGFGALVDGAKFSNTVIVRYSASGEPVLVERVPGFMRAGNEAQAKYSPLDVIEAGEPSPLAQRRYDGSSG